MSFTVEFQQRCRRRERMAEYAAEKVRSMLEPFILEKLYPGTPVQLPNGKWKNEHIIQPHQKKLHERKSINGQTPKHLLFSCVGGETILAGRPIRDWVADQTGPTCVRTLFGPATAINPYRKGQANLYRVRTRSGREVVVTASHRFLSKEGWRPLADLSVGDAIAADGSAHGIEESRIATGLSNDYSSDSRPNDVSPSPTAVAVRDKWPRPRMIDGGGNALSPSCLPSTDGSCRPEVMSLLGSAFEYRLSSDVAVQFRLLAQRPRQSELSPDQIGTDQLESGPTHHDGASSGLSRCICLLDAGYNSPYPEVCLTPELQPVHSSASEIQQGHWIGYGFLERLHNLGVRKWEYYACEVHGGLSTNLSPNDERILSDFGIRDIHEGSLQNQYSYVEDTSFWDEISSIEWDRFDEFYDLTVPGPEHYSAQGLYHHNSGVGAGKSLTLCAEMMRLLRTYPGIKIVVVTAYDYYFDEFLMPIWYSVLPEDSPHIKSSNKKTRSIIMTNGSSIRFKAYDDPDKIKGWQAHVIWIEEGSEIGDGNNDKAYAIWNALLMRLRASRPAYPLRTYITQNPKGHNWLWRIFIKDEPTKRQPLGDIGRDTIFAYDAAGRPKYYTEWEKVTDAGEIFYTIACPSTSNSFIPEGYIDSMLSQMADDPGLRQRMVEGKFNPVNTLVYDYPIFSERTHLISYDRFLEYWDIDEIPRWWRVVVGIDVGGSRSPWAVEFYVQTEDGHWVCFDEIYQPGLTWDQICDRIRAKSEGFENITYWIDPISSQHQQGPTNTTVQIEFRHRGISCQTPKGYNKMGGIARVQNFLGRDHTQPCPYKDDILNEDDNGDPYWENGHATLYYLTGMPNRVTDRNPEGHSAPGNIKEKGVYRWDQAKARAAKATEEGLSPVMSTKLIDRDDHAQTAEMFFALGVHPIAERTKSDTVKRKRQAVDQTNQTPIMYGRLPRHNRRK